MILRRERLYHSHVIEWRQAQKADALDALTDRRTSAVRPKRAAEQAELERLRKEVARLGKDLARRDAALEVIGKLNGKPKQRRERPVAPRYDAGLSVGRSGRTEKAVSPATATIASFTSSRLGIRSSVDVPASSTLSVVHRTAPVPRSSASSRP